MDWQVIGLIAGGLVLLTAGGDLLVRGASHLAALVGISPLVIGLTVVAFGTSAPELAVSVQAGLAGQNEIAVANIVGSNIFNILFILGLCAMILPLQVDQQLVRLDVPLMIGVSIVAFTMALDGRITWLDGLALFSGIMGYTIWGIRQSRQETADVLAEYQREYGAESPPTAPSGRVLGLHLLLIVAGLTLLVLGSRLLVNGAITLALALGVSEVVIGLTIVAAGTSLPEVATSLVATIRHERDIAIGNVVGSNLFNLLSILGIAGLVTPNGLQVSASLITIDMLVMIGAAVACLPIFFKGTIGRWEGALFFVCYVLYTVYLVLNAVASPRLESFQTVLLTYGLPVIGIVILMAGWRALVASLPMRQSNGPA